MYGTCDTKRRHTLFDAGTQHGLAAARPVCRQHGGQAARAHRHRHVVRCDPVHMYTQNCHPSSTRTLRCSVAQQRFARAAGCVRACVTLRACTAPPARIHTLQGWRPSRSRRKSACSPRCVLHPVRLCSVDACWQCATHAAHAAGRASVYKRQPAVGLMIAALAALRAAARRVAA
jgi:hypothetical protein